MPQNYDDLKLDNYNFELPESLIAQRPSHIRSACRLLIYKQANNEIIHTTFDKITNYLPKNSTIVFNRSKVIPCRLFGKKETGGKCELVVLSLVEKEFGYECLIRTSGKKKVGDRFTFDQGLQAYISDIDQGTFFVRFNQDNIENILLEIGLMPIPPYIRDGVADDQDRIDYQTVYAHESGSVAAPTAGLHFDQELLGNLQELGHELSYVSLHVGLGTFAPVKENDLRNHQMHTEAYCIDAENLNKISHANYVVAVGTTSLRALESSYNDNKWTIEPGVLKDTDIFLYPGREVHSIDALVTNFHLPKSTLLMLVASLIGREKTLELYKIAVEMQYRFYSYGDAMLILR